MGMEVFQMMIIEGDRVRNVAEGIVFDGDMPIHFWGGLFPDNMGMRSL